MTRRVLTGKSWPGGLYPRGLADIHRLDLTFPHEAETGPSGGFAEKTSN
jgi:hypothetical protein